MQTLPALPLQEVHTVHCSHPLPLHGKDIFQKTHPPAYRQAGRDSFQYYSRLSQTVYGNGLIFPADTASPKTRPHSWLSENPHSRHGYLQGQNNKQAWLSDYSYPQRRCLWNRLSNIFRSASPNPSSLQEVPHPVSAHKSARSCQRTSCSILTHWTKAPSTLSCSVSMPVLTGGTGLQGRFLYPTFCSGFSLF